MENRNVMDGEFRRASELARESRIFQLAADAAREGARAWDRSHAVRAARAAVRELSLLTIADRLRLSGLLILCAAMTHAALLLFVPTSLAPAAPFVLSFVGALLGVALVVASSGAAAVWDARRRRDVS